MERTTAQTAQEIGATLCCLMIVAAVIFGILYAAGFFSSVSDMPRQTNAADSVINTT